MKSLLATVVLAFSLNAHSQSSLTVKQWVDMYNDPATRQYAVEIYAVIAEVQLDRRRFMLCNKELLRITNEHAFPKYAATMQNFIETFRNPPRNIGNLDYLLGMRMTQFGGLSVERAYRCGEVD